MSLFRACARSTAVSTHAINMPLPARGTPMISRFLLVAIACGC